MVVPLERGSVAGRVSGRDPSRDVTLRLLFSIPVVAGRRSVSTESAGSAAVAEGGGAGSGTTIVWRAHFGDDDTFWSSGRQLKITLRLRTAAAPALSIRNRLPSGCTS